MKFIRRKPTTDYLETQTVSITLGAGGGTDTDDVENLPKNPDTAIEVELDDGTVVVLLGYVRR
jgi:hypothetical protein